MKEKDIIQALRKKDPAGAKELVKARLNKRLRELQMTSFDQYLSYLEQDKTGGELVSIDAEPLPSGANKIDDVTTSEATGAISGAVCPPRALR